MKMMLMMVVSAFAVYGAAKYFEIKSLADLKSKTTHKLADLKKLVYS